MNGKHYVGRKATSFQNYGEIDAVSGVVLIVDEEHEYRAGDESRYVLEVECPYGTQAMADDILGKLAGKKYVAYMAENVPLPVTAELGDGVTVNGIYSQLASQRITFGPGHLSDISAPADGQVSHEFGYTDPAKREIDRKLARSRSYFEKKTDEIRVGVEEFEKGVSAELALKVGRDENDQIVSMLNASADQITLKGNRFVLESENFTVAADGSITAKDGTFSGKIEGGTINGVDVKFVGTNCGLMQGYGATKTGRTTEGIVMYGNGVDGSGNANPPYIIVTDAGIRGQSDADHDFNMAGGQFEVNGSLTSSGDVTAGANYILNGQYAIRDKGGQMWIGNTASSNVYLQGDPLYINEAGLTTHLRGEVRADDRVYFDDGFDSAKDAYFYGRVVMNSSDLAQGGWKLIQTADGQSMYVWAYQGGG